jgi:hypothetical protein
MHFILCILFYALYSIHYILCIVLYAYYSLHCIICIAFYTLFDMHCILFIVFYALYSLQSIICIVFYTLYSMHCILCMYYMHRIQCIEYKYTLYSTGCPAKLFPLCILFISQLPEVLLSFLICPIHVVNKNVLNFYPSCIFG